MNVLSLFDGMSCGRIALERAGVAVTNYYASEVDKYAIKVAQANYPDTVQLGDITNVKASQLPRIDLIIGGSPCQGFSFAGKQGGLDDPRSALFYEYVRLLSEVQQYNLNVKFLLENVRMKKDSLNLITLVMGVEPEFINSALVSAQNRQRYYWTNIPGVCQPEDRGIILADILEDDVSSEFNHGQSGIDYLNRRGTDGRNRFDFGYIHEISKRKSKCLVANLYRGLPYNTLVENCRKSPTEFGQGVCRKLTPIECERLQTVPDNYTNHVSNTQRYKMLGNGWTVDVVAHIFKGLNQ